MEMLDKLHMMVIQPASIMVLLEASRDERKLRIRLHMQTAYREVIIPHETPPINVVDARLMLLAYISESLYDVAPEDAIERAEGRKMAQVAKCEKGLMLLPAGPRLADVII